MAPNSFSDRAGDARVVGGGHPERRGEAHDPLGEAEVLRHTLAVLGVAGERVDRAATGVGRDAALAPHGAPAGTRGAVREPPRDHLVAGDVDLGDLAAVRPVVAAVGRGLDVEAAAEEERAGVDVLQQRPGRDRDRPAGALGPARRVDRVQLAVGRGEEQGRPGQGRGADDPELGRVVAAGGMAAGGAGPGHLAGHAVGRHQIAPQSTDVHLGADHDRLGQDRVAGDEGPGELEAARVAGSEHGLGRVVAGPLRVEAEGRPIGRG